MSVNLKVFLDAHDREYTKRYAEVLEKVYDSGWIEFVFPRLKSEYPSNRGLSDVYGLNDEREAKSFWNNKKLRTDYIEMLKVFRKMTKEEYENNVTERGKVKINSSLNLFLDVCESTHDDLDKDLIEEFLNYYY